MYLQCFENLLTKIEKIAETTTLAKETILTKEGKGEPRKRRRFGKYRKRNKHFHCDKKDTNPASKYRIKRSVQGEALFICQKITGSGARFSKFPVTFRARNQVFKSKYKE